MQVAGGRHLPLLAGHVAQHHREVAMPEIDPDGKPRAPRQPDGGAATS